MKVVITEGSFSEDWVPQLCTHHRQPYAILSHRWLEDANDVVLFTDIEEINRALHRKPSDTTDRVSRNPHYTGMSPAHKPGFAKLKGASQQALKDGYEYIWIDTCCIDISSSAELSEAINSMWSWYGAASVCFAYLADVDDGYADLNGGRFNQIQWWTRGWTLQELLAPRNLTFFSATWTRIGHKKQKVMDLAISEITGINAKSSMDPYPRSRLVLLKA